MASLTPPPLFPYVLITNSSHLISLEWSKDFECSSFKRLLSFTPSTAVIGGGGGDGRILFEYLIGNIFERSIVTLPLRKEFFVFILLNRIFHTKNSNSHQDGASQTTLKYMCPIKIRNQIRHIYLVSYCKLQLSCKVALEFNFFALHN